MGKSGEKQDKVELRFSQEQHDMLMRCSQKKSMTEWNEWRKKNPDKDVCLDGAKLQGCHLKNANFIHGRVFYEREGREIDYSGQIYLREGDLRDVDAKKAWFGCAHLEKTCWWHANARNADFHGAHLEGAKLGVSKLDRCQFSDTYLMDATLTSSSLCGAKFLKSDLRGCGARSAIVDGSTQVWECKVNQRTDFSGVGVHQIRIDSATKQLLQYNIRRMNWERWYPKQPWYLRWTVRKFWQISDYGISTKQIIKTFFQWALIFAAIYLAWGLIDYHLVGLKDDPGIVNNLFVLKGEQETVSPWLVPFRSLYFSIVTMTTLGFGDMYANAHSFLRGLFGHTLLGLQVLLGYVLLGALITRFAVLFTAGGPAGKFAEEKKKKEDSVSPDQGRGQASTE